MLGSCAGDNNLSEFLAQLMDSWNFKMDSVLLWLVV